MNVKYVIRIARDGRISFLMNDRLTGLLKLGAPSVSRASHVVPVRQPLRGLFRFLRWAAGEKGRIADWCRSWRCNWTADMAPSGGPMLGVFTTRDSAIKAEVAWLLENIFLKGTTLCQERSLKS